MSKRPDYIHCIQHTHTEKLKTSWCGKKLSSFDWVFQTIDHAAYSVQDESRLLPCPECVNTITNLLNQK